MTKRSTTALGTPTSRSSSKKAAAGRLCSAPDCSTILSTYNSSEACWVHATPTFRQPLART
ncbi:MAG TPA: hypothetical protein VEA19_03075 [Actinomycetota bacterium]|nr:hypothetical protein [Actinomycetota bacterium]